MMHNYPIEGKIVVEPEQGGRSDRFVVDLESFETSGRFSGGAAQFSPPDYDEGIEFRLSEGDVQIRVDCVLHRDGQPEFLIHVTGGFQVSNTLKGKGE